MAVDWFCVEKCGGKDSCKHRHAKDECVYEYDASTYAEQHRWRGKGDPPSSWWADGTKVYRTFADYCD